MPSPKLKGQPMPVFYFLTGTHREDSFRLCMQKFTNDCHRLKSSTEVYKKCSVSPYQIITDMSLTIFRPCLGNRVYTRC